MLKPSTQQLNELEKELNHLRDQQLKTIGQKDADYIMQIVRIQRLCEIAGRISIPLGLLSPWLWILGVILLASAKILDNMEIGHNVLHGQYDWMNHPHINSRTFEWDLACDAQSWKRTHNYEHHTYTNIIGKDRDFGYGLLRMSNDFKWRVKNLWQFLTYINLSLLFEWGISYHELAGERVFIGKKNKTRASATHHAALKKAFFTKGARQIFKDYIFFPVLCWPAAIPVLFGNITANLLRNMWTSTIIFCGHFTEDVHTFTQKECEQESKGHWYYRQMLGSSNFTGPRLLHIMSGHLSCQIEHHLFPDIPAHRYIEISKQVQVIAQKYGIPYNQNRFMHQYITVLKRILTYSLPTHKNTLTDTIA